MNVIAASLPATPKLCEGGWQGAPGRVGARSTGEDSKQKITKETKALSSAAAKIFVLFACSRKPSEFPSVKNPKLFA